MELFELSELSNRELKNILRKNQVKNYSKLNKKELVKKVNLLIKQQNGGGKNSKKNKKYTLRDLIGGKGKKMRVGTNGQPILGDNGQPIFNEENDGSINSTQINSQPPAQGAKIGNKQNNITRGNAASAPSAQGSETANNSNNMKRINAASAPLVASAPLEEEATIGNNLNNRARGNAASATSTEQNPNSTKNQNKNCGPCSIL
jgi:hypothetical protein